MRAANGKGAGAAMRFGASTFIWASPFSNRTLGLIDKAKAFGFDIIEICIEDPETIDAEAIRERAESAGMRVTVCGAFGPARDMSSQDPETRANGRAYLERCVDFARSLGSPFVTGPMYAGVGNTRALDDAARRAQWARAVQSLKSVATYAAERSVRLAIEPLNRFETDLVTPGEDHLPWQAIAAALRDARYEGPVVIEAFTPEIKEIARAVSIWRPLAESQDALANDGLANLRRAFEGPGQ